MRGAAVLFAIQCLLVIIPTSLAVIFFVKIFPDSEHESARGMLAGVLLRLGLALALVIEWSPGIKRKWAPEEQKQMQPASP
jgi:hypothetical protein